jgi:hypothetical protein
MNNNGSVLWSLSMAAGIASKLLGDDFLSGIFIGAAIGFAGRGLIYEWSTKGAEPESTGTSDSENTK